LKVLLSWLREFADLPEGATEVALRLTQGGIEVEERRDFSGLLRGLVTAEIRRVEMHPRAERLFLCTVFDGHGERRVVCGAQNVRASALGILAPVGATLPGEKTIQAAEIRGVVSEGMLCSEQDLGLAERSTGILLLEQGRPGQPAALALGLAGDSVFTLALTPNRPDCLSHVGVAREAAALCQGRFASASTRLIEAEELTSSRTGVEVSAAERCPRYAARIVEGIAVGPSPGWLRRRLELCGIRSINNVVDATNYVLLELGHPLHAFDLDRLAEQRIVVRTAREGETLTTLDGQVRRLCAEDLVIADAERAQALAGVMGGADSEVSDRTRRLLLESAYFEPRGIRRTARRHGLHTEASHRFERGADPEMVPRALDRVAGLIVELAGGRVLREAVDAYPRPVRRPEIRLSWGRIESLLGSPVSVEEALELLARVGVVCSKRDQQMGIFQPPSWRPDLERDVDLIEEVARLRGYDKIPATLPAIRLSVPPEARPARVRGARLAVDTLTASGLSEAVNFSFVAPKAIAAMRFAPGDQRARPLSLRNPLSEEVSVLRTSLLPGLLKNAAHNLRHGVQSIHLFEVGRVFWPVDGERLPDERLHAALIRTGRRPGAGWDGTDARVDFYDVKGVVEDLLEAFGVREASFVRAEVPYLHPRASAEVRALDEILGVLGEVHPQVTEVFELGGRVFSAEIDLSILAELSRETPRFSDLPRFPPVYRDMAVVVSTAVTWQEIREVVLKAGAGITCGLRVFDVYTGAPVPEGKKSVAFALTYQAPDRTLTDEEVGAVHEGIRRQLEERLGARIRE
jgi:phenylalanyl-tRNA synthetase beta chain